MRQSWDQGLIWIFTSLTLQTSTTCQHLDNTATESMWVCSLYRQRHCGWSQAHSYPHQLLGLPAHKGLSHLVADMQLLLLLSLYTFMCVIWFFTSIWRVKIIYFVHDRGMMADVSVYSWDWGNVCVQCIWGNALCQILHKYICRVLT